MTAYLVRRLIFGSLLIFLSTVVSFAILKASPGTAVSSDFDPRLSKAYRDQQMRLLGLDRHPVRQYLDWLGVSRIFGDERPGLLQGNLGVSFQYKQPVSKLLSSRLPATLALNIFAL